MAASFKDVRKYERAPVREGVIIVHFGRRYRGVVTRIGGGGVYVETNAPAYKDEPILLRMRLPCLDEPTTFKGEVRWTSASRQLPDGTFVPPGLGVMFVDVSPVVQRKIVEFVADTGDMLYEVSGLLADKDPDLAEIQSRLSGMDLAGVGSLDELREAVREEMAHYFKRA